LGADGSVSLSPEVNDVAERTFDDRVNVLMCGDCLCATPSRAHFGVEPFGLAWYVTVLLGRNPPERALPGRVYACEVIMYGDVWLGAGG
jgi:polyferredoxin